MINLHSLPSRTKSSYFHNGYAFSKHFMAAGSIHLIAIHLNIPRVEKNETKVAVAKREELKPPLKYNVISGYNAVAAFYCYC